MNEDYMADDIADSSFKGVLGVRLRRRVEGHDACAYVELEGLLGNEGGQNLSSLIITADRGYGRDEFANYLPGKGISSLFLMPVYLGKVHPFDPATLLRPRGKIQFKNLRMDAQMGGQRRQRRRERRWSAGGNGIIYQKGWTRERHK